MSRTDFKHLFLLLGPRSQTVVRGILGAYIQGKTALFPVRPTERLFSVEITHKEYSGESLNTLTIQEWLESIIAGESDALIDLQEPGISEINSSDSEYEMLQKYHMSSPTDIGYGLDINALQGAVLELRALKRHVPLIKWPKLVEDSINILNDILPKVAPKPSVLPPLKMASNLTRLSKVPMPISKVTAETLPSIYIRTKTVTKKEVEAKQIVAEPLPPWNAMPQQDRQTKK